MEANNSTPGTAPTGITFAGRLALTLVLSAALVIAAGCGGNKAKVASGGGAATPIPGSTADPQGDGDMADAAAVANPAPATVQVKGPNLNGNDWHGFIEGTVGYQMITATVRHIGEGIVIITSKPEGVAHELRGRVKSSGNLVLKDPFDGQTWTTLFGPASPRHIRIADYVIRNDGSREKTNILDLTRG